MPSELPARFAQWFVSSYPCDYCGATPTALVCIVPPVYADGTLKRRGAHAYLCTVHSRQLQLVPGYSPDASDQVGVRKALQAGVRKDRRDTMKDNQGQLFTIEHQPRNALLEE